MVNGYKVSSFAGDNVNINLIEEYMQKIIYSAQQTDLRVVNRMLQHPLAVGVKRLNIAISKKIDGETGYKDTMLNGIVSGIMNSAGADIQEVSASAASAVARYGQTQNQALANIRRQVKSTVYDFHPLIPRVDTRANSWISNLNVIQNEANWRWNRYRDSVGITAMGATVVEIYDDATDGTEVDTDVPFPTGNIINSAGNEIATGDVLEEATYLFETADVDMNVERPIYLCAPKQKQQLRDEEHLINYDYATGRPLDGFQLPSALGYDVVVSNLLPITDNVRTTYAFFPSGIVFAEWEDMDVVVDNVPSRKNALQISMTHESGATRVSDELVLKIMCLESSAVVV